MKVFDLLRANDHAYNENLRNNKLQDHQRFSECYTAPLQQARLIFKYINRLIS